MILTTSLQEVLALTRSNIKLLSNNDELTLWFTVDDDIYFVHVYVYDTDKIYISILNNDYDVHLTIDECEIYIDTNILSTDNESSFRFSKYISEEEHFQLSTVYPIFSINDINYINFYYNLMCDEYKNISN